MSHPSRKPFVGGNAKMNNTAAQAAALYTALRAAVECISTVDIVVAPSALSISAVKLALQGSNVALATQTMHWEKKGAFSGDLSPAMVAEFCSHVILGHSEQRKNHGVTDQNVNLMVRAALEHNLIPIVCVGETQVERDAGRTLEVVSAQIGVALDGIPAVGLLKIVLAYEPVWAIEQRIAATPSQVDEVHKHIRLTTLKALCGLTVAQQIRIIYGGAVNPKNAAELLAVPDVDGFLVGSASLSAEEFSTIIRIAAGTR